MKIKDSENIKDHLLFFLDDGSRVVKHNITGKFYDYPSGNPFEGPLEIFDNYTPKPSKPKVDSLSYSSHIGDESIIVKSPFKFSIISVSPQKDAENTLIFKSFERLARFRTENNNTLYEIELDQLLNNSTSLSKIYNMYISDENRDRILVFVHDDVLIDDMFIFDKLTKAHEVYDIVGIAGCVNPAIKSPAYWHLMAHRSNLRGFCGHLLPNGESNMTVFGNSKTSVDMIDGVFMSMKVSSLLDNDVNFNESFDFHFYDLAFSLNAKLAGLKLGVWPISIRHESLGGGDENWKKLEEEFINQYKNKI